MKIMNPIMLPVSACRSPSGQMRVKDANGGKVCAVARNQFDEEVADQIVRSLNARKMLVAAGSLINESAGPLVADEYPDFKSGIVVDKTAIDALKVALEFA